MNLERAELGIALVLSALVVIPLAPLELVPTMDGFHHVLHGVIGNHFADETRGYASFLQEGAPITSLGFHWLFTPLEPLLGWRRAYMFVLATIALAISWAGRFLIRSIAGNKRRSAC